MTDDPLAPDVHRSGDLRVAGRSEQRDRAHARSLPLAVLSAIGAGGALGAVARYSVSVALPHGPGDFPLSTFLIDVSGCLLIGALVVVLTEVMGRPHQLARPFFGVGLLGGYTTFSAYTTEALALLDTSTSTALAYLFGTLLAAVLAVQIGVVATRAVVAQVRKEPGS
jgi:CrcB protein